MESLDVNVSVCLSWTDIFDTDDAIENFIFMVHMICTLIMSYTPIIFLLNSLARAYINHLYIYIHYNFDFPAAILKHWWWAKLNTMRGWIINDDSRNIKGFKNLCGSVAIKAGKLMNNKRCAESKQVDGVAGECGNIRIQQRKRVVEAWLGGSGGWQWRLQGFLAWKSDVVAPENTAVQ